MSALFVISYKAFCGALSWEGPLNIIRSLVREENILTSRKMARQGVRVFAYRNAIYLNNPKAGCSSIKRTVMEYENSVGNTNIRIESGEDIHPRNADIFDYSISRYRAGCEFIFSFVRNPFSRVLSVYLDKIKNDRSEAMEFKRRVGFPEDQPLNLDEFLDGLNHLSSEQDDPHWRPQYDNLLSGKMPLHYIGYVESFEEDFAEVSSVIFGERIRLRSWMKHSTGATEKVKECLSPENVEVILKKYHQDFEMFGYSRDPAVRSPTMKRRVLSGDNEFAFSLIDQL